VSEPGDAALVRRAQRGSREAGAALFARHWEAARRAALAITGRPATADDVAQAAFVRAFAALDRFDADRPFAPWLHRIVVNGALDHLRAERRLVPMADPPEPAAPEGPGGAADAEALAALARLSPERRAVVVLRHLLDYRPPEIAEVLGLPLGTVNSRLARALVDLRRLLEGEDD
jgi:RNA polymerase sigma-70 factor (ECF subfamily)